MVLGNHDVHLIGLALGVAPKPPEPGLAAVLAASDAHELVDWLRKQPLTAEEGGAFFVHAGLAPSWTLERARSLSSELSQALTGPQAGPLLAASYSKRRGKLLDALAVLTRIRMVNAEGVPNYRYKGAPADAPEGLRPWFEAGSWPTRRVFFGHWAALGLHVGESSVGLDTGCVWGGALTAYRVEDGLTWSEPKAVVT